jgi:acyl dehydratase
MPVTTFENIGQVRPLIGQEIAVGDWFAIDQPRIAQFAEATEDRQWIHLDAERAAKESPFGGTIAHGYLTLSLIPALFDQALVINDIRMGINYGLNRVRFTAPVRTGQRVRLRITPISIDDIEGGTQVVWRGHMELEGSEAPALVAEIIVRRYV